MADSSKGSIDSVNFDQKYIEDWTVEETCAFLRNIKMGKHQNLFRENGVDGKRLKETHEAELQDLGIEILAHRKKILKGRDVYLPFEDQKFLGRHDSCNFVQSWKEENKQWLFPSGSLPETPLYEQSPRKSDFIRLKLLRETGETRKIKITKNTDYTTFTEKVVKQIGHLPVMKYR
eukprot:CAMPEP_0201475948 /NCGR_PEP_ID=MMETSP0151_2-20130828/1250_1 /ASSEMBLY_ACC=CAM_ASM_000257 /TAXON_ID=200890 /ORGANISM="Paramoeba atlantica, Strain 621/1 / CCAP 1560/9" /LENGTH=175 /DNA_ID=CAMNT_0047856165 /DNA_START=34 /DNA_END=558 /DNA_ORIENTATION=+